MINRFKYIEIDDLDEKDIKKYKLNLKLIDTESKHIVYPQLHKDMVDLSSKVGYDYLNNRITSLQFKNRIGKREN